MRPYPIRGGQMSLVRTSSKTAKATQKARLQPAPAKKKLWANSDIAKGRAVDCQRINAEGWYIWEVLLYKMFM